MLALEIESSPGSCKRSPILGRISKIMVLLKLVRTRILHVNTLEEGVYMQNPSPHKLHQHQDFVNPP